MDPSPDHSGAVSCDPPPTRYGVCAAVVP